MQLNDSRPNFGRIDFEGLPNTRDLGGLPAADGRRVRSGLLLRSGTLYFATAADRRRLMEDYHLRAVVDLRGDDELAEYPDGLARMPGTRYVHADALKGTVAGISQDAAARAQLEAARTNDDDPARVMEMVYPHILLGESGVAAYRALLRCVLSEETTVGKHAEDGPCSMDPSEGPLSDIIDAIPVKTMAECLAEEYNPNFDGWNDSDDAEGSDYWYDSDDSDEMDAFYRNPDP